MRTTIIETRIRAPIELCFDLARDVNAHAESAAFTSERVVEPGRTQGLLYLWPPTNSAEFLKTNISAIDVECYYLKFNGVWALEGV